MDTSKTKLTNEQMADMAAWDIANHLGIGYSGDMDPIKHGGFFYGIQDWQDYGYASVVEFWEDPENGCLVVQRGVINRLEGERMESALRYMGMGLDDPNNGNKDNLHYQVEACRGYAGIEVDGTGYPHLMTYNLDHWQKERNIWKSVRAWIEALAD